MLTVVLALAAVAWGAFAFGAVYDWAYTPLFWACAAVGLVGLSTGGNRTTRRIAWPVVAGIALIAGAALVQLVPLAPSVIARISPATDTFLKQYNVVYRLGETSGLRHPLSIDPAGTRLGLVALGALGFMLIGLARALGRRSLRVLAAGIVIVGFLLAIVGIVQSGLYGRDPAPTEKIYGFWEPIFGKAPFGPFVNRNHFAGWMLLGLPVAIGYFAALVARGMRGVKPTLRDRALWFSSPDASRVVLVGLAILVMGLSLVLTLSRSGISCFLLSLALSAWFVLRRVSVATRGRVVAIYLALVAVLTLGWVGLDTIASRFSVASADFWVRLSEWSDAWRIFRDFPLVGTGLNTYGTATLFYQTTTTGGHYVEAHNDYVQLLAEGGALLAVPALAAVLLLAREIRRRFSERVHDATTYWIRVGATTGLVAIAFQEIVEFSLQIPGIAALFALVAAIAIHRAPPPGGPSGARRR